MKNGNSIMDRMKNFYEDRTRMKIIRRSYTIIRCDGRSFKNYTKGLEKPFDDGLIDDIDQTTKYLCENIQGAKLGFCQSDEISILLTDFDDIKSDMWFDGNIQKMVSISSSMSTSKFNKLRSIREIEINKSFGVEEMKKIKFAEFDSRVFQIPQIEEVINYFIARQHDATRNSISSVAQSLYLHKELNGKSTGQMQEMIYMKGVNWNDYSYRKKRGGIVTKVSETWMRKKGSNEKGTILTFDIKEEMKKFGDQYELYERSKWESVETPIFSREKNFLKSLIPNL
jgi:tRNA(His) guanylyltransferase